MPDTSTDKPIADATAGTHEWADYLDQRTASQFLKAVCGVTIAPKTLQKRRVIGGGPPFRKVIGRVVYERAPLKDWGEAQRSSPVTSTSALPRRVQDRGCGGAALPRRARGRRARTPASELAPKAG